jgi:hypothetical protein
MTRKKIKKKTRRFAEKKAINAIPVILSEAKNLCLSSLRFFATLRMTSQNPPFSKGGAGGDFCADSENPP